MNTLLLLFSRSVVSDSVTLWTLVSQATLSFTVSQDLFKLMSVELVMPSNHLILCRPFFCLQSFPASGSFSVSRLFESGGQSIGASASASVLPTNIQDWFPSGLTVWSPCSPRTLKSLLLHYSSRASVLWCSAFFIVQLSHPYMTTGKTIALTRWTFVGKVMSLLFNMLSTSVIAFLSRSKYLLTSWLQLPSAVILEPNKIVCHCFHCFPIYSPWSDGTRCHNLGFLNVEF